MLVHATRATVDVVFFFSSRRRHTRCSRDWSSDVCSSDLTDGSNADSTIFDLTSLKVLDKVKTDKDSDAVIYDPFSKRVFTFNGDANTASAIDAASGKLVSTFPLGGGPEFGATDGEGQNFANLEDKSSLVKVDAKTLKIENT